jgi:predicted kinase
MVDLILISGAPGSGKTTLAAKLAGDLEIPMLAKDDIKEDLADTYPVYSVESSRRLGQAAIKVLYHTVERLRSADVHVVVDNAFHAGLSEPDLAPLLALSRTIMIHCSVPSDVATSRYRERAGLRHPAHQDSGRHIDTKSPQWRPLNLDVPLLVVDSSDGYRPGYPEILAFARQ